MATKRRSKRWGVWLAAAALVLSLGATGCGGKHGEEGGEAGGGGSPAATQPAGPPPEVVVSQARRETINPTADWPAQIQAGESVDVKARVEGTLENFTFKEGARVRAGQVLFTLDASPYIAQVQRAEAQVAQARAQLQYAMTQVDVRTAQANLASARAELQRTQQDVDRYTPLAANQVIPQQTLDNAVAQRDVAKAKVDSALAQLKNTQLSDAANIAVAEADVQAAQAQVTTAQLNVGYCTITSPIDGIVSTLNVDPGNLVGQAGNQTPLVTISSVDPIYVNFSISDADYLMITKATGGEEEGRGSRAGFQLTLADGTVYPGKGRFGTIQSGLDAKTGTLQVRAIFPNPKGLLRSGQFGRIQVTGARQETVVLVPQKAVTTLQSLQMVYVVGEGDKVSPVTVQTAGTRGNDYIVSQGLKGGETVVVEGIQKLKDGMVVKTTTRDPADAAASPEAR